MSGTQMQREPDTAPATVDLKLEVGLRVFKIYNGYWFFGWPTVEELARQRRSLV